jgi:DNA-binding transcriptional MerR regulator
MTNEKKYSVTAVAAAAHVSVVTLYAWLKTKKVPEPMRDRAGKREFTETDLKKVLEYANKKLPPRVHL